MFMTAKIVSFTLLEKCPNTEVFLVRIFPHSDYLSIFSPNAGIYGPGKTPYLDTFHTVFLMLSSKQKNYIIPSISLFLHILVLVDLLSINRLTWSSLCCQSILLPNKTAVVYCFRWLLFLNSVSYFITKLCLLLWSCWKSSGVTAALDLS